MRRDYLICLGLLVLNLVAFWPVGHLGFIVLDDPAYVRDNPNVQQGVTPASVTWALTTIYAGNWHPMAWISHMVDYDLFGLNANGHHWMNLGFHVASTLLLFIVLRKMTSLPSAENVEGTLQESGVVWCSALVAALFAVHPMHLQSVAWIAERKDVLSGFFMMLTLWMYATYAQKKATLDSQPSTRNSHGSTGWPWSSLRWE